MFILKKDIASKRKIFCIGRNKTGTTSVEKAFLLHGLKVGKQAEAELLIYDYAKRNFKPIVRFCKTAQAFQDIPFSLPNTYQVLDYYYPNSKFILTIRDDEHQWYNSLVNFHAKLFGNGKVPTKKQLQNATYRKEGFMWDANRIIYNTPEETPYHESLLKTHYLKHNEDVKTYFSYRERDLLILNVAQTGAYKQFCDFLELKPRSDMFPWENKT